MMPASGECDDSDGCTCRTNPVALLCKCRFPALFWSKHLPAVDGFAQLRGPQSCHLSPLRTDRRLHRATVLTTERSVKRDSAPLPTDPPRSQPGVSTRAPRSLSRATGRIVVLVAGAVVMAVAFQPAAAHAQSEPPPPPAVSAPATFDAGASAPLKLTGPDKAAADSTFAEYRRLWRSIRQRPAAEPTPHATRPAEGSPFRLTGQTPAADGTSISRAAGEIGTSVQDPDAIPPIPAPFGDGAAAKAPSSVNEWLKTETPLQIAARPDSRRPVTDPQKCTPEQIQRLTAELKPIRGLTADAGISPGVMPGDASAVYLPGYPLAPVSVGCMPQSVEWVPPCFCHQPLYFEDPMLERHGQEAGCMQTAVSGGRFFFTVGALPYLMVGESPCECVYPLGHFRPGSCVPLRVDRPPLPWETRTVRRAGRWLGDQVD